jgi:hypothetical protein
MFFFCNSNLIVRIKFLIKLNYVAHNCIMNTFHFVIFTIVNNILGCVPRFQERKSLNSVMCRCHRKVIEAIETGTQGTLFIRQGIKDPKSDIFHNSGFFELTEHNRKL